MRAVGTIATLLCICLLTMANLVQLNSVYKHLLCLSLVDYLKFPSALARLTTTSLTTFFQLRLEKFSTILVSFREL